jgi:hypothetical protein
VNPFNELTMIVEVAVAPDATESEAGDELIEKSGVGRTVVLTVVLVVATVVLVVDAGNTCTGTSM